MRTVLLGRQTRVSIDCAILLSHFCFFRVNSYVKDSILLSAHFRNGAFCS